MNDLNHIVSTFSNEDRQRFTLFLEKRNKRKDNKNIQLFKHLLANNLNSDDVCFKLYGSHKKGAYHALRKRLYQSIIDFIANTSLQEEKAVDMQIIKFILERLISQIFCNLIYEFKFKKWFFKFTEYF